MGHARASLETVLLVLPCYFNDYERYRPVTGCYRRHTSPENVLLVLPRYHADSSHYHTVTNRYQPQTSQEHTRCRGDPPPHGCNPITPRDPVGTPRFRGDHQPQYCRGCSASNARAHTEANHRSEQCQYCRHWVILLRAYTQATRTMGSQTVMPLEAP